MIQIVSNSPKDTQEIAARLAKKLCGTEVIAFYGGLGMGKTAFTRGLAFALGAGDCVSSPTFAIVNEYSGKFPIYHFDMYRIQSWDDLYSTGFFDYLGNGVTVIEWSENVDGALPDDAIRIYISKGENDNRRIFRIEGADDI